MKTDITETLKEIETLKAELALFRPLPPEALKKTEYALDVEYTYESNRIEGNTLTLQETALIVSEGITISGKSMREHLEAINHVQAIDFIKEIAHKDVEISEQTIKEIHAIILQGIDRQNSERYRTVPVMILGSNHTPPSPYLIEERMENFMAEFQRKKKDGEHPILIAAYLHGELVRIHPFIDGNGRTSRLLMNLYLLQHGYSIIALKGDADKKRQYYEALEASHTNPDTFNLLVARAEKESIERYINFLK